MKYLGKQMVMILMGLSVMLLTGNVIAADVNTSQVSAKQVLSDLLPDTSGKSVGNRLVLAQLGSVNVSKPIAQVCNADNQCVNGAGNVVPGYFCCGAAAGTECKSSIAECTTDQ
jgi:hypothetical protein